ncbi:MAG: 2,3,4,5-tetrahydropyridine-2,6-dicarboxylate N-succinyltransferase [bacterium]
MDQIERAWEEFNNKTDIKLIKEKYGKFIKRVLDMLDKGKIRVCEKVEDQWIVNEYTKKAILLYFAITKARVMKFRGMDYFDKVPLKKLDRSYRVVPGAIIRYGSFVGKGVVVMPSFINVGARVEDNTMVDTWVTVGSCAQVGKNVHLAGGVGIGGVLEPPSARPVIIEDDCFIGSRCIIVEGVIVRKGAVLASNVSLTSSTKIIDINTGEVYVGEVPEGCVVVPGTYLKEVNGNTYGVSAALIIGKRKKSTDLKTQLNEILRI